MKALIAIVDDDLELLKGIADTLNDAGHTTLSLHVIDQETDEIAKKVMPARLVLLDEDLDSGRKTGKTGQRVREALLKAGFTGTFISTSSGSTPEDIRKEKHFPDKKFLRHSKRYQGELTQLIRKEINSSESSF